MKHWICMALLLISAHLLAGEGPSLADQRLEGLLEDQKALMERLDPDHFSMSDEQSVHTLIQDYEAFLADNPDSLYGHILYGKWLRELGEAKHAQLVFMKANKIDPHVAVVKQQIGNYLAETGNYTLALPYFLNAIELAPDIPLYHYQLGELLCQYKELFIEEEIFTPEVIDANILEAFQAAARLAPEERRFAMRSAEAYFDIDAPSWDNALDAWDALAEGSMASEETDLIRLQRARVLIKLERFDEAKKEANCVYLPTLEASRRKLLAKIESQTR